MTRLPLRALTYLLSSCLLCWGSAAMAQDEGGDDAMDFTEGGDGATDGADGATDGADEGAMDFSVDEVQATIPEGGLRMTAIVLRTEDSVEPGIADPLGEALINELDQLNGFQVEANLALKDRFATMGEQGTLDCIFNPVCLGRVGAELGLQRLVIGRLSGADGNYTLNLDLVNVEESLIADYTSRTVQGDLDDLKEVLKPSVSRLFNIRQTKTGKPKAAPDPEIGPLQKGLAWTTLGVGVVCVGLGTWFGLEAMAIEDELTNGQRVNVNGQSVYNLTPLQAQARLVEGEDNALYSNIFFGVGLAAGVTSALLFFIKPGSDIATEEELKGDRLQLAPTFGAQGAGVSAQYRW